MKKGKGTFAGDTFEKLAEMGKSTVKKTGKSVSQTFDPSKLFEQTTGSSHELPQKQEPQEKAPSSDKTKNHTPLDFAALQKKYEEQDREKMNKLRGHLFRLVKEGEQKVLEEKKKEEKEKVEREMREKEEKKKKDEEEKKRQQDEIPRGKQRISIFSPKAARKRAANRQRTEIRPSTGKQ